MGQTDRQTDRNIALNTSHRWATKRLGEKTWRLLFGFASGDDGHWVDEVVFFDGVDVVNAVVLVILGTLGAALRHDQVVVLHQLLAQIDLTRTTVVQNTYKYSGVANQYTGVSSHRPLSVFEAYEIGNIFHTSFVCVSFRLQTSHCLCKRN